MCWYSLIKYIKTQDIKPSFSGRGEVEREMARRGKKAKSPTSSFFRERTAHAPAFSVLSIVILIWLLPACKPDAIQSGTVQRYFDIQGYFKADTARLNKLNRLTLKTVIHNGVTETKKIHVNNWGLELNTFSTSDINKPAWRDSYNIQNTGNTLIYTAKSPELKTREIIINKNNNKVKWIMIFNYSKNTLYQTSEKLSYFPDSIYIIQKYQKVRLLGANRYTIKGTLN